MTSVCVISAVYDSRGRIEEESTVCRIQVGTLQEKQYFRVMCIGSTNKVYYQSPVDYYNLRGDSR